MMANMNKETYRREIEADSTRYCRAVRVRVRWVGCTVIDFAISYLLDLD